MTRPTDAALWAEVRECAARYGWDNREWLLDQAHRRLSRRFHPTDDEGRKDLRGRLDRLWIQHMTDWGVA